MATSENKNFFRPDNWDEYPPDSIFPQKKKTYQKKPSTFKTAVANMTFSNGYSGGVTSKKYIRRIELTQGDKVARKAKVQSCMVKIVYLSKVQVLSTESFGVTKIVVNVVTALLCRQQVSCILSLKWRLQRSEHETCDKT